ncbi:MAG: hypothetical protein RL596_676 [Bacteroidota bacterium]|jgi:VanZ family protein
MDLIKSFFSKPIIAFACFISFFLLSIYLFTLPKSGLQRFDWITIPYFDKIVHILTFFILFFLFTHFLHTIIKPKRITLFIALISLTIYGISVEFIQEKYISGRSFEQLDILADISGCVLFLIISFLVRKKIGPDGNRGRNQN